jgi:hypothetical protein
MRVLTPFYEATWFIRKAIGRGWDHSSKSPDFILEATNEVFRVGGVLYVLPEAPASGEAAQTPSSS